MRNPKETLNSIGLGPKSEQKRSVRVAEAIRNELSLLLLTKARDHQLGNIAFSRVQLSDDLSYARIFFTTAQPEQKQGEAAEALERAKGFMRSHLARVLNMRYTPELHFVFDRQVEKIEAMEKLFQEIARERGDSDE